jgi:RecF/RecN/SMC N terminal domain
LEDRFNGDWEAYLKKIESASPAIRALGITDYYSIATYRQVVEWKRKGRLAQAPFIFPNVEMRLDVKTSQRAINIHLLFSPDDPNHEQEIERVLSGLTFEYNERIYRCSRNELIALGRSFDPKQTTDDGAFAVGVNQFKVIFSDLRTVFRQDHWLRENSLVAVVAGKNDGTSGLQVDDAFAATREEIQRFANVIFSGNPTDREFWLGRKTGFSRDEIERKYQYLKPCLHGCDAHSLEAVAEPHHNRFCWIKGDLAFESLRQVAIEPEERVWIGPESPEATAESIAIDTLETSNTGWLETKKILFNRGLVSIIGARGSGKTALADLVAAGAHSLGSSLGDSSFLLRATTPDDLIGNAKVTERWVDGSQTTALFRPPNETQIENESFAVCYLSQHFVNQLCSAAGLATQLRREIERVVFEQTNMTNRYETDSFVALSEFLLRPTLRSRQQQAAAIRLDSDKIAEEDRLRDELAKLRKDYADLDAKIKRSKSDLSKLLPKDKEKRAKLLLELEAACSAKIAQVEALRRREKALDGLLTQVIFILDQDEPNRFSEMQTEFAEAKFDPGDWESFRMRFYGEVNKLIASAKKQITNQVDVFLNGDSKNPIDTEKAALTQWPLSALSAERDRVKKEVAINISVQKRYDILKRSIETDEAKLKRSAEAIRYSEGADERRKNLIEARRLAYRNIFETFAKEQRHLSKLYEPLHQNLEGATGALAKLKFVVTRHADVDQWVRIGEDLLDLRKESQFRGHGALSGETAKRLTTAWRTGDPDDVASAMHEFVTDFWSEFQKAMPAALKPDERRGWMRKIGQWLYSVEHISIDYGIEYDGVPVERLSPGTRGIVLLLLYLAIDRTDRRPLLIDQPEENLDPKSVFDDLVPHFREARRRRQLIVVTHNANLVVNTDADQVIVATATPGSVGALPIIKYEGGSLENPNIRKSVCDILEGGERAFLERELRYRLQWKMVSNEREVEVSAVLP